MRKWENKNDGDSAGLYVLNRLLPYMNIAGGLQGPRVEKSGVGTECKERHPRDTYRARIKFTFKCKIRNRPAFVITTRPFPKSGTMAYIDVGLTSLHW